MHDSEMISVNTRKLEEAMTSVNRQTRTSSWGVTQASRASEAVRASRRVVGFSRKPSLRGTWQDPRPAERDSGERRAQFFFDCHYRSLSLARVKLEHLIACYLSSHHSRPPIIETYI